MEWETLITGEWEIAAGSEEYYCVRQTIEEDMWIRHFAAVNPGGTHHTVLSVDPPTGPDGIALCPAFEANAQIVFGSGVGENTAVLPEGVGVHFKKGDQILLNLHVFNTNGEALVGESGTRVIRTVPEAIEFDADSTFTGTIDIEVPPGMRSTTVGGCVIEHEATAFAVFPHMHNLGIHMRVTAETQGQGHVVLWDAPYDLPDELTSRADITPIAVLALGAGLLSSVLTPCLLQLVVIFGSIISSFATVPGEVGGGSSITPHIRRKIMQIAFAFVAGFTLLYTLAGALIGKVGHSAQLLFAEHSRMVAVVSGVVVIR